MLIEAEEKSEAQALGNPVRFGLECARDIGREHIRGGLAPDRQPAVEHRRRDFLAVPEMGRYWLTL